MSRKITDNLFRILYFGIQDPKFEHWQNEIHTYFHEISYSLMASPIINFHPKQKLFFNLLWDEPFEPHPIRHTEYRVFEIAFEEEPLERNDSEFREKLKSVAIDYEKIAREIKSFYTNAARELYVEHFISKEKIKEWLQ
ncbi:MAG: hypothetical protein KGZ58_07300 [Ignavibacteriales bacterium]|nr:hypothetical protein [Ignavibacteriales bacterium]